VKKESEVTLARLFAGYYKEHLSDRSLGTLAQRLAPEIEIELSKQWPTINWDAFKESIEDKALEMLNIPVITGILLPAWRQYQDIKVAVSSNEPGGQTVWLAQHTVSSTHHPHLDVRCYGVPGKPIELTVAAEFTVDGFGLMIQAGRIRKIKTSSIEGQGSLGLGSVKVEKRFGKISLPDAIDLGEGIPVR